MNPGVQAKSCSGLAAVYTPPPICPLVWISGFGRNVAQVFLWVPGVRLVTGIVYILC